MMDYVKTYWSLKHDRRAVTALEYSLIAGLVAVAIITAVTTFGSNLSTFFNKIGSDVSSA